MTAASLSRSWQRLIGKWKASPALDVEVRTLSSLSPVFALQELAEVLDAVVAQVATVAAATSL